MRAISAAHAPKRDGIERGGTRNCLVLSCGTSLHQGDDDDPQIEPVFRRAGADEILARIQPGRPAERPGRKPDGAGQDPRLADQWLRLLPRYAYRRGAQARGDGAASLPARRLARLPALQRARTRGAGLDRGVDEAARNGRVRRGLSRGESAVQRGGAGDAHASDRRHQRLEPDPGRLPRRSCARRAPGGVTAANRNEDAAASFDPLRPRLIRIAYRMLGSFADAEDAVQEAFLRWLDADRASVREPEA